ncbi:MAG TPA: hypothetical protein VGX92_08805 [Pyrinomonadaceae bacterium]|jgi:hypothetical protein|nr:hypothetical protein [Pyrinomonadaceae bacterium]
MMRRILSDHLLISFMGLSLLFALAPVRAAAQGPNEIADQSARKFDEFGQVGGCDYGARLDNFAIQLQNEPTADGYIVCYGPKGEGSGTGKFAMEVAKDYLVNARGLMPERIKTIYGGRYKEWNEAATELWIAPRDAAPPVPMSYNTEIGAFTGKFSEYSAWDDMGEDGGTGPTHGHVSRASFADMLRELGETRAYIVAYNTGSATPGAWRRVAREIASDLQYGYQVGADRIKIIYGGYRKPEKKKDAEGIGTQAPVFVQLWILHEDAPPPVAEAKEPEQMPTKAVRINTSSKYTLSFGSAAQSAFQGFADVLRSDERMSACLIVRLDNRAKDEAEADGARSPADAPTEAAREEQWPEADLMAVVNRWKSELVENYGISEHRLIVITAEADQSSHGSIETWLVPPGAALPDPDAQDEIAPDGEAMEFSEATR